MRLARPLLVLCLAASTARAETVARVVAEATVSPGWRVALSPDDRASSFEALTAGVDALLGVEIAGLVGIVTGGRFRYGKVGGESYLEASGDLGAEMRLGDRARGRIGATVGEAFLHFDEHTATMIGGFAAVGVDLIPFSQRRGALALVVRLDVDAFLGEDPRFPKSSMALAVGIGGRY